MAVCVAGVMLAATQVARAEEKAAAAPASKSTMGGKIEAIDAKAGTITIKHKTETKTFTVGPNCTFSGEGDKKLTLADLKIGDSVKVSYAQEGDKLVAHHVGHVNPKKKTEEAPAPK